MDIQVTTSNVGNALVVSIDGVADLSSLPTLRTQLDRIVRTATADKIVIDLDGISLVDDTTLGLLLGAAARLRDRRADFSVVSTDERVRRRLRQSGFDRAVDVHTSIAEATSGATSGSVPAHAETAVIFTNRLHFIDAANLAEYDAAAARMEELAARQPGYLGIESVRGDDGVGITVSYWESSAAAAEWKRHAEHLTAQHDGRERWYEWYRVRVATIDREYFYDRGNVSASDDTE